jgi:O-antigen/teichoic acid export membrane protein
VIAVDTIANIVRFLGLAVVIAGLWFSAGGLRVVVSGRIDERRRSSQSLKVGLPLLAVGLLLLFGSFWLASRVHP